jgi:hypothetical protein
MSLSQTPGSSAALSAVSGLKHAAPVDQPRSVSEIAARLFPAYTVDGGSVHLAGCRLDDRLFLRLEFTRESEPVTLFVDMQGNRVDQATEDELGLRDLKSLARPALRLDAGLVGHIDAAVQSGRCKCPAEDGYELVSTTAVWCKRAIGRLRFEIGDLSADLPFDEWARTLKPPPFVCPATGSKTYHLSTTDDGRIVDAGRLEHCAETGQLTVDEELVTCSSTGLRVAADQADVCPVSGEPVLARAMVSCRICHQQVSASAVKKGVCAACRQLRPVRKADPRLAQVLDEHPKLDRFGHWRISETADAYILSARRWLDRLVVVVDKDSLELRSVASGSWLFGLRSVPPEQYDYVLRD